MIHNQFNLVNKNKGVKIPNARVWAGWDKGIYIFRRWLAREAPKQSRFATGQAGKKKKGCGENEFLPARRILTEFLPRLRRGSRSISFKIGSDLVV